MRSEREQIEHDEMGRDIQDLKGRLGDLEKRVDMLASVQHNRSMDSLTQWRRKGGLAKAKNMTAKERSEEMRAAARKRWDRRKQEQQNG